MLGVGHAQDAAAMRLVVDDSAVLFLQLQTAFEIQQVWVYKHCCKPRSKYNRFGYINIVGFGDVYLQRACEKGA